MFKLSKQQKEMIRESYRLNDELMKHNAQMAKDIFKGMEDVAHDSSIFEHLRIIRGGMNPVEQEIECFERAINRAIER